MVAITAAMSRQKIASGISSVKCSGGAGEVSPKLDQLRRLRSELLAADSKLLVDFLSPILELLSEDASPVRKYVTQMVGQIGLKHLELLPEMVPAVIDVLVDDTPAVARQAITSSIKIFRSTLVKVAIQGLYSSEFNESLKSSWACVQKLRDEIYSMAFKVGSDGRRLAALKFVESIILLYTPDPNASLEPPPDQISDGNSENFNVSWLRGGHPILNVGDMSVEASRSLGLLLDQLRPPTVKSHSNLMIVVLIKSLSTVARKRPAFYGRILPVLLGLDPYSSFGSAMHIGGVRLALKNAFEACLNCSYPGAAPWRDRLVSAITDIKVGRPAQVKHSAENDGRSVMRDDSHMARVHEEEKSPISESLGGSAGRKRSGVLDTTDLSENEGSAKRARSTPDNLEGLGNNMSGGSERRTLSEQTPSEPDEVSGPVQQLVAMFGALAAQGEKAAASLEILISSISADLLAEVVMANLRNLPSDCLLPDGDEEQSGNMGAHSGMQEGVTHLRRLALLLTGVLSVAKSSAGKEIEGKESCLSVTDELEQAHEEELQVTTEDNKIAYDGLTTHASQQAMSSMIEHAPAENIPFAMETSYTSEVNNDNEITENEIPGLSFSTQAGGLRDNLSLLSKISADFDDSNQDKSTDSGGPSVDVAQVMSIDRSEELSPKAAMTDTAGINSSSALLDTKLVLPKISAPVIQIADAQKDELQELAFGRIVDAYKQVAVAGGSQVRFSILAHSGMEFPSELDPWKLLKTHILSDYANYEGHELTLRVLYRLYGEAEEDRDFFSSTTATSVYESFFLQVAETLRDSFPASDKSLGRLLADVPYIPKSVLEMLERLCSPGTSENDTKEALGGDRVTQGLSTAWNLILSRPPIRDACLRICLKCAVHHLEEIRMKAIRLVANKLYPLSSISGNIEDFAKEMLVSVVRDDEVAVTMEADGTRAELLKDKNPLGESPSASMTSKDMSVESQNLPVSESISPSTLVQVQRCMSLYFALCTKKHSLLRQIFDVYEGASKAAKQAIHSQIPLLVRTIGSSRDLLDILSDPPTGSQGLLTQVVNTLTDGIVPSPDLVSTVKGLYNTKIKDIDIIIPVLPFLAKDEVLLLFPHLVNTPMDKFQVILSRVIQGLNHSTALLTPTEALIAIHGIDPDKVGIPLKKVTDACNVCFEQRQVFTQQVLAKVLNQLVEQIPLPLLFMRTVLQAIGAFPGLVDFIMEILSRLVSKQIWKYPKLWVGFMKCTLLTKPQSFGVLLQLPPAQLENALNRTSALRAPLVAHASQPHIRSTCPRSTLVVLGIASDPQPSAPTPPLPPPPSPPAAASAPPSQTQTGETETETGETSQSEKEEVTEKSKESSSTMS